MKEEIKDLWVAALRSGEYQQGRSCLRNNDKFCCLGVLCDISQQNEWNKFNQYDGHKSFLPPSVQNWSGMRSDDGFINKGSMFDKMSRLSTINDTGQSFEQIADIIEEHWRDL